MIQSVVIEGYRGFSRLEMGGLGRVNLLVGRNNSGKTSALEAIFLWGCHDPIAEIWKLCRRRGETIVDPDEPQSSLYADIIHLFHGHTLDRGSNFVVRGDNGLEQKTFRVDVDVVDDMSSTFSQRAPVTKRPMWTLTAHSPTTFLKHGVELSEQLALPKYTWDAGTHRGSNAAHAPQQNVHYLSNDAFNMSDVIQLWDLIQLTQAEDQVLSAVRLIDDQVKQLRSIGAGVPGGRGSGFIVKLADQDRPVPLGSLGDGVRRMLAIAIVMSQCAGGRLFIDEIDTGLHHTVMSDLWRLILGTAKKLDVQVFATTHSLDCVHSLASICGPEDQIEDSITIQRIERGRPTAVRFSEDQIRIVAEQQFEIR